MPGNENSQLDIDSIFESSAISSFDTNETVTKVVKWEELVTVSELSLSFTAFVIH